MTLPRRALVVGLGPIGRAAAVQASERPGLALVGAVDHAPDLADRPLREVLDGAGPATLVEADLATAIERLRPEVAFLCTASTVPRVAPAVRLLAAAGVHVVASCEELVLPTLRHPALADELDRVARQGQAVVVGTGVNPGFVLDLLPAVLTAACRRVDRIRATRVVDAATRRRPLQAKVGAGIGRDEFAARAAAGAIGHVGIAESAALLGRALGMELAVEEALEPVLAERDHATRHFTVPAGSVAGVHHTAIGRQGGRVRVELDLVMAVGAADPGDRVEVEGEPSLRLEIPGGVPGDSATASILVATALRVFEARPGLRTVLEVPPARGAFGG